MVGRTVLKQGVLQQKGFGKSTVNQNYPAGLRLHALRRLVDTKSPHICIYRSLGGIGDVLMTTPSLRAIKYDWPESKVVYATDLKYMNGALKDILTHNPYIDEIIAYQAAKGYHFDIQVDVTSTCVTKEKPRARIPNRIDMFADAIGVSLKKTGYTPIYRITNQEKTWAKAKIQRITKNQSQCLIGIQVKSSARNRTWPIDRVKQLALLLAQNPKFKVIVFDDVSEEKWNFINIEPILGFGIREVAALVNELNLIITPDSGLMHLAGALSIPNIAIFGGTDYKARINHYPNAVPVSRNNLSCYPCWYDSKGCNHSIACLQGITVDEVYHTTIDIIQKHISIGDLKRQKSTTNDYEEIESIEIKRDCGGLGDIINMTCAVKGLKLLNSKTDIHITVPTQYKSVFDNNPHITTCSSNRPIDRVTAVYNLTLADSKEEVRQISKKNMHPVSRQETYITETGGLVTPDTLIPELCLTQEEILWAKERFFTNPDFKYIAVALETAEKYRAWPFDKYMELLKLASDSHPDWCWCLIASQRLEKLPPYNVLDCSGFAIRRMFSIVQGSDIILTPDTSILHVAAAFNKPCIALFGPISSQSRCSHYKNTIVLKSDLECIPCWRNQDTICRSNESTNEYSDCMNAIKPETVLNSIKDIIK